jgi:hypothetical protein
LVTVGTSPSRREEVTEVEIRFAEVDAGVTDDWERLLPAFVRARNRVKAG